MKPKKRGIKRHVALQPLSRHHMEALYLGVKLRRAGTEKSALTTEELVHEVKSFWDPDGERHFREEEEILLPTYAKYGDIKQEIIVDMLLEHVKIRSLVRTVTTEAVDVETLHALGELLETHIRKEERIIFPMIEKALPEDVLQEMAPYIHD